MPRIRQEFKEPPQAIQRALVTRLVQELKSGRPSGQPIIYEQTFATGAIRVNVIWDEWDHMSLEDRTAAILQAYELAEGPEHRDKIALASGLTVPEAHAAGMLPYQIIAALRKNDPVTLEQCREAMIQEGASRLLDPEKPQLRFETEQEAEESRQRLSQSLPDSEPVWLIIRELDGIENRISSEVF